MSQSEIKAETKPRVTVPDRSRREEIYNTSTHLFGFLLAIAGSIAMIPKAINTGRPIMVAACIVYLLALMGVYASSFLSHAFSRTSRRVLFRILDQAFIYLLIVASYTPFSIRFLDGTWWWCLLGLMWAIALTGFISKVFFSHRVNSVSVWVYLALGWIPAAGGMPFTPLLPAEVLWAILAGGVFYTAGTFFLYNDRRNIYCHSIWHLFVIAGSVVHYWAIMHYVL